MRRVAQVARQKRPDWQWPAIEDRFPDPASVDDHGFAELSGSVGMPALIRSVTVRELRRYPRLLELEAFEVYENECRLMLWRIVCSPSWRRKAQRLNSLPDALAALFHDWARAEDERLYPGPSSQRRRQRAAGLHRHRLTFELGREPTDEELVESFNDRKRQSMAAGGRNPDRDRSVYLTVSDLHPPVEVSLDESDDPAVPELTPDDLLLADGEAALIVDEVLEGIDSELLRDITQQWLAPLFRRRPSDPAPATVLAARFGLPEGTVSQIIDQVRPRFVAAIQHHGWWLPDTGS